VYLKQWLKKVRKINIYPWRTSANAESSVAEEAAKQSG